MKRDVLAALRALVLPTAALAFLAVFASGRLELAARIYALVVCGVALVVAVRALRRADPPETALRDASKPPRSVRRPPPSLARLEQLSALGVASSFDLQFRLLPPLRAIASGLLEARRGIALDRDRDAARRILGEEAWELLEPSRAAPVDRASRGITQSGLTRVVDSLESI